MHATQAYVTVHPHQLRSYAPKIAYNESLFTELVAREFALKDTHTVVYHAHAKFLCVYQDFLKKLYEWEYGVKVPEDFVFLRWWHDASAYTDVQTFLDKEFKQFLDDHYQGSLDAYIKADRYRARFDHGVSIKDQLLSVNLGGCSLKRGEDTLRAYLKTKFC